jgi:endonuclease I
MPDMPSSPLRRVPAALIAVLLLGSVVLIAGASADAGTTITVAQALSRQDGSSAAVRGYVVGQPVAASTVITSGFATDHALALADDPAETDTGDMLYVQITSVFRPDWGLAGNPGLLGTELHVTGILTSYFSHGGLKSPTAFTPAGGTEPDPEADPGGDGSGGGGDDSYDGTYYADAAGLSGPALKAELHDIIADHDALSYGQVWGALRDTDEDPADPGSVLTLYSDLSLSENDNGGDPDDWNREHVWPRSRGGFGTTTGPGTDIHHIRPEDVSVNSARGSHDFDEGGSPVSQCTGCYVDGDSFEPPDEVKGDVARMIFYMAVRYEGDDGWPDLELNDAVGSGSTPYMGRLSELLEWNAADPPDAFEKERNDRIYENWQHNRNPFVDHPEWADAIWS